MNFFVFIVIVLVHHESHHECRKTLNQHLIELNNDVVVMVNSEEISLFVC